MKLSIVVPIYNIEDYLDKCLNSVLNQTFKDFECLLVIDGIKDNSYLIAEKYAGIDYRFKVIYKPNGGLSDARNVGMEHAMGEYIYFLDGDDFLYASAMEKCVNKLDETKADMVIFDVTQHNLEQNTTELLKNDFDENQTYTVDKEPTLLIKVLNAAWNKMYRKDLFIDNNLNYPIKYYYEDLGTTYRLMLKSKSIAFINEPLYNYLADRPGNITSELNMNVYHVLDMVKINLDYFKANGVYEKYYEELKFLGGINIIETLKKTRNVTDAKMVDEFIDVCFYVIKRDWPEFPKCKYNILRHKHDWIYANKNTLKTYLKLRRIVKGG
ncbi:MAG: glycosyltransferase family 2 protein [Bacillota bacterium]|jgi:glycosyltransferase involved in cell wall biosynthesis|nr:glycosyltransferase family 2 protein [Bacillota bacterium]